MFQQKPAERNRANPAGLGCAVGAGWCLQPV